jgi:hypothetical protein
MRVAEKLDWKGLIFICAGSSLLWGNQCVKRVHEFVADISCRTKMRQQLVSLLIVMHCQMCRMSLIWITWIQGDTNWLVMLKVIIYILCVCNCCVHLKCVCEQHRFCDNKCSVFSIIIFRVLHMHLMCW